MMLKLKLFIWTVKGSMDGDLNLSDVHGALSVGGFTEKFEINVD